MSSYFTFTQFINRKNSLLYAIHLTSLTLHYELYIERYMYQINFTVENIKHKSVEKLHSFITIVGV